MRVSPGPPLSSPQGSDLTLHESSSSSFLVLDMATDAEEEEEGAGGVLHAEVVMLDTESDLLGSNTDSIRMAWRRISRSFLLRV